MRIKFENPEIAKSNVGKIAKEIISNNATRSGNVTVKYIPWDEIDDYDDESGFVEKNKGKASEFYMVYSIVAGSWEQPLSMVAVMN